MSQIQPATDEQITEWDQTVEWCRGGNQFNLNHVGVGALIARVRQEQAEVERMRRDVREHHYEDGYCTECGEHEDNGCVTSCWVFRLVGDALAQPPAPAEDATPSETQTHSEFRSAFESCTCGRDRLQWCASCQAHMVARSASPAEVPNASL